MESRKSTREEIEKTIESIDGISRADMPPFFYTRLQAKLNNHIDSPNNFWAMVTRPAVSLVTLSLLVVLNVAAISYYLKSSKKTTSQTSTGIEAFAQEYDLATSSAYHTKTTNE
ncbi:MAG: hypothetical protein ABI581_10925 [Sediminibacterium sp.]